MTGGYRHREFDKYSRSYEIYKKMRADSTMRANSVVIRGMREDDFDEADRIMRLAFGTYLGLPDPMKFMGDADFIRTRFKCDPSAALTAEVDGRVVGSNFALNWGTVGIFGPLTIDPDYWNRGVAKNLLEATMKIFERWGTRHTGLFTFSESAKHVHLYQKFGFWPRYLTAVMSKRIGPAVAKGNDTVRMFSSLNSVEKESAMQSCGLLTNEIHAGLDLSKEISSVDNQELGDTILVMDPSRLKGFAICHSGPNTEAGTGNCYVKFGAVAPGPNTADDFDTLLNACEQYSQEKNLTRLICGVNTGRHRAYAKIIERGFRTDLQGIAMHKPNEPGYNVPEVYIIDDWR